MWEYIVERVIREGEYILLTKSTIRQTAKYFNVSKSTVHKDVSERLQELDITLYEEIRQILETNLSERHIRGGNATKQKYMRLNNSKNSRSER